LRPRWQPASRQTSHRQFGPGQRNPAPCFQRIRRLF
jgi:hypothetical protein